MEDGRLLDRLLLLPLRLEEGTAPGVLARDLRLLTFFLSLDDPWSVWNCCEWIAHWETWAENQLLHSLLSNPWYAWNYCEKIAH